MSFGLSSERLEVPPIERRDTKETGYEAVDCDVLSPAPSKALYLYTYMKLTCRVEIEVEMISMSHEWEGDRCIISTA